LLALIDGLFSNIQESIFFDDDDDDDDGDDDDDDNDDDNDDGDKYVIIFSALNFGEVQSNINQLSDLSNIRLKLSPRA